MAKCRRSKKTYQILASFHRKNHPTIPFEAPTGSHLMLGSSPGGAGEARTRHRHGARGSPVAAELGRAHSLDVDQIMLVGTRHPKICLVVTGCHQFGIFPEKLGF